MITGLRFDLGLMKVGLLHVFAQAMPRLMVEG